MKYLLDVNVLIALAHQDHADHRKVSLWFRSVASGAAEFNTCAITELGFARVSVQAGLENTVESARKTLTDLQASSAVPFRLLADSLGIRDLPKFVKSPAQLTDGHLLEVARSVGARLVTLDKGIPGALLVV